MTDFKVCYGYVKNKHHFNSVIAIIVKTKINGKKVFLMGRKIIKPRCMILKAGCPGMHKLGDIGSSNSDELIDVFYESKNFYIGSFFYGMGFLHVKFKKEDVRPMNEKELESLRGKSLPWHWDDEGYYLEDV